MELVELNVGGTLFTSTSRTLLKYPESRIARLTRLWLQRRSGRSPNSSCFDAPNGPLTDASAAADAAVTCSSPSPALTTTVWERKEDGAINAENNASAGPTAVGETQQQPPLELLLDSNGRIFMDRSGDQFGSILEFLRNDGRMMPPEGRVERERLKQEAEWYGLSELRSALDRGGSVFRSINSGLSVSALSGSDSTSGPATVTIGYRGTFSFGRESLSDVKFRKMSRILVCGRVAVCRAVFGETLNESRDPDRGEEGRYSSRFYLKHTCLEQAFDMLLEAGFRLGAACGCGSAHGLTEKGLDNEEAKWQRCARPPRPPRPHLISYAN